MAANYPGTPHLKNMRPTFGAGWKKTESATNTPAARANSKASDKPANRHMTASNG